MEEDWRRRRRRTVTSGRGRAQLHNRDRELQTCRAAADLYAADRGRAVGRRPVGVAENPPRFSDTVT